MRIAHSACSAIDVIAGTSFAIATSPKTEQLWLWLSTLVLLWKRMMSKAWLMSWSIWLSMLHRSACYIPVLFSYIKVVQGPQNRCLAHASRNARYGPRMLGIRLLCRIASATDTLEVERLPMLILPSLSRGNKMLKRSCTA